MLQVCTCVLARQTIELVYFHHHDQTSAKLKVSSSCVDSEPNEHVGNNEGGVVTEGLGHDGSNRWCGDD